jgi:hypothetical protein
VAPGTGTSEESFNMIVMLDVAIPLATIGLEPLIDEFAALGTGAVKTTVPSSLATGDTMESVFVSAVNDLRVQVETPDALVAEQAE